MNRNASRVRWTADERATLVQRAQLLIAEQPGEPMRSIASQAISGLPVERRRKLDAKTVEWLRSAVRALPQPMLTSAVAPESVAPAQDEETLATPAPIQSMAAPRAPNENAMSPAVALITDGVVAVLLGVLRDPRLHVAAQSFLANALASASKSVPAADGTSLATNAVGKRELILVAGLSPDEAKSIEKAFAGMLPVKTWGIAQTREQLDEYIAQAHLVIGMQEQLSPSIDSSLRRLGDRYVSHRGGMPALHKRLAEQALR